MWAASGGHPKMKKQSPIKNSAFQNKTKKRWLFHPGFFQKVLQRAKFRE